MSRSENIAVPYQMYKFLPAKEFSRPNQLHILENHLSVVNRVNNEFHYPDKNNKYKSKEWKIRFYSSSIILKAGGACIKNKLSSETMTLTNYDYHMDILSNRHRCNRFYSDYNFSYDSKYQTIITHTTLSNKFPYPIL